MAQGRKDEEGFPRPFGKYELLERIGDGGMAEVFRARLPGKAGFEKIVVIKRILPHLVRRKQVVDMFLAEARLTAQVQHKNIVQVFELGEDEETGDPFMVMEHIAGADLKRLLQSAVKNKLRIPPWFSVHVVAEVLDGLAYAHELTDAQGRPRNIVHRDVTPSNVFVSFLGETKLGDFGIAKEKEQSSLTRTGQLKGKVAYMAPEQLYGEPVDERTDVFSAGIVLWECLAQKRLFGGRPDIGAMKLICDGERPPPSRYAPDVPEALDKCVLAALLADRSTRTKSAREFQSQLLEIQHALHPITKPQEVRSIVEGLLGKRKPGPDLTGGAAPASTPGEGTADWSSEGGSEPSAPRSEKEEPAAGRPKPSRLPTELDLSFEQSMLADEKRAMPVAADLPAFREETDTESEVELDRSPQDAVPSAPPDEDDPKSWLIASDELHHDTSQKLAEYAQLRWEGYGELGEEQYAGPQPFFIRDGRQKILGPHSLDRAMRLIKAERHDRLGPEAEISADRESFIPLGTFANLTWQEGLFFDDTTKVPMNAALIGYLDQESMVNVATVIARERLTGRLHVSPETRRPIYRVIDFVKGAPIYVFANEDEMQLPEVLVARQLILRDRVPEAIHRSLLRMIALDEVAAAFAGPQSPGGKIRVLLMKDRLVDTFRWSAGRYAFDTQFQVAADIPPFARSLLSLVPEIVQRAFTVEELRAIVLGAKDDRIQLVSRPEVSLDEMGFSPAQREVAQWIAKGKKLSAILKLHPREERLILLVTHILFQAGLLVRS